MSAMSAMGIGSVAPVPGVGPAYLRRWATVLAVALFVLLAVASVAPRLAQAGGSTGPAAAPGGDAAVLVETALVQHVVVPGDTLWDLAVRQSPSTDPRATVDRIMVINGLTVPALQVGETVLLPNGE